MDFDHYQECVRRTENYSLDPREQILNYLLGLGGEVGELLELFKKHYYHGHNLDIEKVQKELGDIAWYHAAMHNALQLSLKDTAIKNYEKLLERYPGGFSFEDSINRKD